MKDFEHLISVWQGQPKKEQLSVDEVLKQVKKGIRSITSQLYWGIVAMPTVLVLTFVILFFFVFQSWLTYVGIFTMLITMLLYAVMIIRNYRILKRRDATLNPNEYLQDLKEYQKNRAKITGWFYYIYLLLISIGLSLYFIEILKNASTFYKIAIYSLTIMWFLFLTFWYKKRIFKNEEEKLNLMIDRLERLQGQFE
jgi:glucan phosphoethanolaminetransferase (alkaline phosphatase superfamily)